MDTNFNLDARAGGIGSVTQIPEHFPYQSYLDNALLQNAILDQTVGEPIITSTRRYAQTRGVGVALHPSSESPVAIQFEGGASNSAVVVLTPGEVFYPGSFEGFVWGLPFGWLGGGQVLLYVIHRDAVRVDFADPRRDVAFHRQRMVIDPDFAAGMVLRVNWPDAFPWINAFATAALRPQLAGRIVTMQAGPVLFRLRSGIAAPITLSLIWRSVDLLDTNAANVVSTTELTTYDLSFPAIPLGSGAFPVAWLPEEVAGLIGGQAALNIVDPSGTIDGEFIDVVRYGRME